MRDGGSCRRRHVQAATCRQRHQQTAAGARRACTGGRRGSFSKKRGGRRGSLRREKKLKLGYKSNNSDCLYEFKYWNVGKKKSGYARRECSPSFFSTAWTWSSGPFGLWPSSIDLPGPPAHLKIGWREVAAAAIFRNTCHPSQKKKTCHLTAHYGPQWQRMAATHRQQQHARAANVIAIGLQLQPPGIRWQAGSYVYFLYCNLCVNSLIYEILL